MSTQYKVLVIDTDVPNNVRVPKLGDETYLLPITLNDATGNEVAYDFQYTVNKATSGNDTGLRVNKVDTASPGTSLLLDLQTGGVSQFKVDDTGIITANGILLLGAVIGAVATVILAMRAINSPAEKEDKQ